MRAFCRSKYLAKLPVEVKKLQPDLKATFFASIQSKPENNVP